MSSQETTLPRMGSGSVSLLLPTGLASPLSLSLAARVPLCHKSKILTAAGGEIRDELVTKCQDGDSNGGHQLK